MVADRIRSGRRWRRSAGRARRFAATGSPTGSTGWERSPIAGRVVTTSGSCARDVAEFFKGLRPALDGGPFPYVWVPEWHPGGHGLHVHFAVGRYVPQTVIRDTWGRGHVHIKLLVEPARRVGGAGGGAAGGPLPVQVPGQGAG